MAIASSAPFDFVAAAYDEQFTHAPVARLLREAVWARADLHFRPGMRVLDLGCGTGEDAIHFARRGVRVCATDLSPEMLAITRQKAEAAGMGERIATGILDLATIPSRFTISADPEPQLSATQADAVERFDGVFSNFGALNCVTDLQPLVDALGRWTRPGTPVVLVLMGPLCIWEVVLHLIHLQPGRAARRWRRQGTLARIGGTSVRVFYPSPRRLARQCASAFRHVRTTGLGVFVPPPYVRTVQSGTRSSLPGTIAEGEMAVPQRVSGWLAAAARLDRGLAGHFPFNQCGDHYIVELERRP